MSSKRVASNLEWQAWGKKDPLFAVATLAGKEKDGATPWTDEEFYDLGRQEWEWFHGYWRKYGVNYQACAEIGCGAGRITRQLAGQFQRVHALDVSPEMVAYARRHVTGDQVKFHLTDGSSIPLPDKSVTAVFSCHVFQHFDRLSVARDNFREIYRVLSSGGTIMIHLPAHTWARPVRIHRTLHSAWEALAHAKMTVNRILLKAGLFPLAMRTLSYPVDWLFRELPLIGFQRLELALVPLGSSGASMPFLFASRA